MAWPKEIPVKRYPSDVTDEEWEVLKVILDKVDPYVTGRPRQVDLREVLNAIFYLNKTGCPWRYLPKDFPPYVVVSYYYQKWVRTKTWEKINTALRQDLRKKTAELRTLVQGSSIVKPSRARQSRRGNRDSTVANSSADVKEIL